MTVYRICRSKYPANDGEGATLYCGRWNPKASPYLLRSDDLPLRLGGLGNAIRRIPDAPALDESAGPVDAHGQDSPLTLARLLHKSEEATKVAPKPLISWCG